MFYLQACTKLLLFLKVQVFLKELQKMVKEANNTFVDASDVLSDRVLFFDREKERLVEPKVKEREGEERSER